MAWRTISRNRLYTLISIFSLALGICGCIVIWLVTHYDFSFDRFHPDGGRIYRVGNGGYEHMNSSIIPPMPDAIRRTIPNVEAVTTFFSFRESSPVTVPADGKRQVMQFSTNVEAENKLGNYILTDAGWFTIFQYQWLVGDPGMLGQPFRVVLSEDLAIQYFGSLTPQSYIGRELIYEDSLHVRVAGIVKGCTDNTDMPYSAFISLATIDASFLKNKRHMDDWVWHEGMGKWYWPMCFVKLAKGARAKGVEAGLLKIGRQVIGSDSAHPFLARLQPLQDIHFNTNYKDDGIRKAHLPTLYVLMAIALFILILGMVNFVNLSTAQSIQRAKEIGVRKVLGGKRSSIIAQFLTETLVITMLAVGLAALLVSPVMAYFREYLPLGVHFRLLDPTTLLFLVGIAVITTLLAGFYPAKVLAGYLPVMSLKGVGAQKGGEKWLLRKSLIVFQFTISLVFIIVSLLMGNQIRYMLETDYGFMTNSIVTVNARPNFWDTTGRSKLIAQEFRQLPGIAEVIPENSPPVGWGGWSSRLKYNGREMDVEIKAGDASFIPFYGMHLVAGRNIRQSDRLAEWVINESGAKSLGLKRPADAIGKMLYDGNSAYPIVGVVADFHEGSFKEVIKPTVIGHLPRMEGDLGIRLANGGKSEENIKGTLTAMEKIFKKYYPNDHFDWIFMDESITQIYETEQKTAALVRAVVVLAVFISCMGLFGLAMFTAQRKAAEISIRKVLGATTVDIAALLNKRFVELVLLSLVIASPLAWWLTDRWLRNFAYRTPISWWVFPLAGLGAILIAMITVSFQSIRAAMANPINNLRSE